MLEQNEYKIRLKELQNKIADLHNQLYRQRIPVIIAFEGWDAGGKGGAIKRLTTSRLYAPWIIVEGNSKYYARIKVLETVVNALEDKLDRRLRYE